MQLLQEKVVKGSFITLSLTLLGSIFAYLIRILYSHTLTIENYGLFYAVFASFNLIVGYGDLGFGYAIVYLLPKYLKQKDYSRVWNIFIYGQTISLAMSLVAAVVLVIIAPFLADYYFKVPGSENLIYILCIYLVVLSVLNGLVQLFTGLQKEKYFSSITATRWFLTLTFSILFFLFDLPNVIFYAFAWAFGHILTAAVFLFLFLNRHPYLSKNKIIWNSSILRQMFSLALPALLENFVGTSVIFVETFLLTLIRGVKDVGVYNVIYPLTSISVILLAPINNLILPLVSHLMEGERQIIKYLVNRILEIIPFIGIYFSLFLILFPSNIVGLIFGQKWLGLVELPLTVLSVGSIGFLISEILGTVVIGTGKIKARLKVNAILAVFSIILDVFLIWKYGVLGVVITNSLIRLALGIWCLKIVKEAVSFQIPLKFYLKMIIISIMIFSIVRMMGLSPRNLIELVIYGIVYTILFALLGLLLKIYDKRFILILKPKK